MWNLLISTIVFFVAVWYLRRYLEDQGIPKGFTRGVLVFVLASVVSWVAGEVIDWTQEKIEGPRAVAGTSNDLSKLLNEVGQLQQ